MSMSKTDWQDTMIGVVGLVAALTALYVSLKPAKVTPAAATSNTVIEPSSPQGFSGSVGSGSPALQEYANQQIAQSPYGKPASFPSATLGASDGGNIIFPPLQDEGLAVPALAPINNNINIGTCCGG